MLFRSRNLNISNITTSTLKDTEGSGSGTGGGKGTEPDENVAVRTNLTAQSNVGAATSTLLQTSIEEFNKQEADLTQQLNKVNQSAINAKNLDALQNAQTEYSAIKEKLQQVKYDKVKAQERFNRLLSRKTSELYPGQSWNQLNNLSNQAVVEALKKDSKFKNFTEKQLYNITKADYNISLLPGGEGVAAETVISYIGNKGERVYVSLDNNTAEKITTNPLYKKTSDIKKLAQEDTKLVDQIQTTGLSFNEGASKALKGIVSSATLYDASNTKNVTQDFVSEGIDMDKVTIGQYHPEIDRVSVNIDGTTYLMDVSNARTKRYMASKLLGEKSTDMQRIGRDLLFDVDYNASKKYEDAFGKGSGVITTHPLSPSDPIIIDGKEYGIKRVSNPKTATEDYVFINNQGNVTSIPFKSGTKTRFTFPEIKTILNNLIQ